MALAPQSASHYSRSGWRVGRASACCVLAAGLGAAGCALQLELHTRAAVRPPL